MINISNNFIQDTKTNITSISCFINIFPDVRAEQAQTVMDWLEQSSDSTNNNEILDTLVAKYGSRKEYMDAIHKYSTKNMSIKYGSSNQDYSYDPLITKQPKIRNSIDIKKKMSKISNMKIGMYNNVNNYEKLEGLENCYNSAVAVYWKTESCINTNQCVLVFVGGIDNIDQNNNITTINCLHASNIYNDIQVPMANIPYSDALPEKYKQKPYPMVYGEVDGAYASMSKVDVSTAQEFKHIVFDQPNIECEGFVDPDLPYVTNDNNEEAMYKTDRSQIYIADGDNLVTMLRYCPYWLWGDPNSYDYSDIHNGYSWRYTYTEQYRNNGVDNGVRALTFVGENPRRVNPIKNDAVMVQFKDTFDGITMFNHEEGDDVPNGFDIGYANSGAHEQDYLPTGNAEDISGEAGDGIYWINNCDLIDADKFFNKGDYQNRDARLKFRFWTTYTEASPVSNNDSDEGVETLRGMRCQFVSKASSISSYRHFVALHFRTKLKQAQYISKFDHDNGVGENHSHASMTWNSSPDGRSATLFTYPFGAIGTGMYWIGGSFHQPEAADYDGWIPNFYPAMDHWIPLICSTRHFPFRYRGPNDTLYATGNTDLGSSPNMNGLLHGPVIQDGQVVFDTWNIDSETLNQNIGNNNYNVNNDNFYLTNRSPWEGSADHIYDWLSVHAGGGNNIYTIDWWAENYQKDSKRLAEEDDRLSEAGVHSIQNDGTAWRPKTWAYADTTDTTLMMLGVDRFKYGLPNNVDHGTNNEVHHTYNELEIYDVYADRIYMKDDFLDSDFFAKVRGRLGYTSVNGNLSSEAVERPNEVLYHFLSDELGLGKNIVSNNDDFQIATLENSDIKTAFSINEKQDAKKIIEKISKESKVLIKYNSEGTVTLDSMKEYYGDEDVDLTIKSSDIFKYKFKNTKLSDIKNQVKVNYNKKYANNSYENTSGFYTDPVTGEDLYSIMIDDILQRSTFFEGYQGNIFNYDEFSYRMYNNLNTSGLDELNNDNKMYSVDYYNMRNADTKIEIDCDTIRDYKSASELQKYLILWNCNQHLIVNLDLPIKYIGLETGDIINFDKLLGNKKAFNFDYTKRYVKNGQVIYPYFMITKVDKSIDKIKIEAIQLHRLDWGLDGHSMNIDSDATHNANKEIAYEGQDSPLENVVVSPSTLYFNEYEGNQKLITITAAYAEIESIDYPQAWLELYYTSSDDVEGRHVLGFKTTTQNPVNNTRTGTIRINFQGGEEEIVVGFEQQGDTINFGNQVSWTLDTIHPDTISNHESSGQSDIVQDPYDIIDKIDLTWNFGVPDDPTMQIWDIVKIKASDNVYFDLREGWSGLGSGDNEDAFTDGVRLCDGGSYYNGGSNLGNGMPPASEWVFIHWISEPYSFVFGDNVEYWYQDIELVVFQRNAWDGREGYGPVTVDSGNQITVYQHYGQEETDDYAGNRAAHLFIEASLNPNTPDSGATNGIALDIWQEEAPHLEAEVGAGSGDWNGDGTLNILDILGVINVILGDDEPTEDEMYNLDINYDGILNIQEVIIMIGHIIDYGGEPIPEGMYGDLR